MGFERPALSFELGLTAGFGDHIATVAWTDITDKVVSWNVSRGRTPAKPPQHFDPGVANLVLNNRGRDFDPTNTAGPYWPNLKPAKVRLRIRADLLSPNNSGLETDASGWVASTNCTVARSTAQALDGVASLAMTAVAAGDMTALSSTAMRVREGVTYKVAASYRAATTARGLTANVLWFDAAGAYISTGNGALAVDATTGWATSTAAVTAPAGATYASVQPYIGAAAAGEVHYVDRIHLWAPVFVGYVKRWPPEWTASATSTVKITAVDALGAPLNLPQLDSTIWASMVRHDKPKAWYRLDESSGTLAADSTASRLDGQYQGSPALGQDGLVTNDPNKGAAFPSSSRMSLPYKNLISGYPWSFECWFRANADRARQRMILCALDAPLASYRQAVVCMIDYSGNPTNAGHIIAFVANGAAFTESGSTVTVDDLFRHHMVLVMASPGSLLIYLDGTDHTIAAAAGAPAFPNDLNAGYAIGNTPALAFGDYNFSTTPSLDVIDEAVFYDYALSPTRVLQHYQGGAWPVGVGEPSGGHVQRILTEADWPGPSAIDAGASSLQMVVAAGGVVANLQKTEEAEQGALFMDEAGTLTFLGRHAVLHAPYTVSQATFGQGVGDLPYEAPVTWGNDDAELYNRAKGSRVGGIEFTVDDEASQAEFGQRPLPAVDGLWNLTDQEVVDLLAYRVGKYAQPTPSVRQIRVHPAAVPSLYSTVLALGLRSRITVKVQPPGGGPVFTQPSHIEHLLHEGDDKGDWWVTYDVSAADTTPYLVLDDPVLGLLDSGNRVAF